MLILSSPAKNLNFETDQKFLTQQIPYFKDQANKIAQKLQKQSVKQLAKSLQVTKSLAEVNYERYQIWDAEFETNIFPAIDLFAGDVYQQLNKEMYSQDEIEYVQKHFYILSGIYGLLNSLDMIQPYRLEMKLNNPLKTKEKLANFWHSKITDYINLIETDSIINLASGEYSKALDRKNTLAKIIDIEFRQLKDGDTKNIGIFAKQARGKYINWMIINKIENLDSLIKFQEDGYKLESAKSEKITFIKNLD